MNRGATCLRSLNKSHRVITLVDKNKRKEGVMSFAEYCSYPFPTETLLISSQFFRLLFCSRLP
uniref:Uncharacterized protein n=1 Tax=Arion vulgaris TaxID=1028688 RepID=A0A0B6ZME3_9EUPU